MKGIISIVADDREERSGVLSFLRDLKGVSLSVTRLRCGDYIVHDRIIFERKTSADFVESVIDGRLFRQANQLNCVTWRPAFLVEGGVDDLGGSKMTREAIIGALLSISLVFDIPVIASNGPRESAQILIFSGEQAARRGCRFSRRFGRRVSDLKRRKLRVLEALPGIGVDRAKELLNAFGSVEGCLTAEMSRLIKVSGIGKKTAEGIRTVVEEADAGWSRPDRA